MQARGFARIAGAAAVAIGLVSVQAKAGDIELQNSGDNNLISLSHVQAGSITAQNTGPGNAIVGRNIKVGSFETGNSGDNNTIDLSKIRTSGDLGAQNGGNNGVIVAHDVGTPTSSRPIQGYARSSHPNHGK